METTVPRGVEADAFFAFNNLMSETKDLFIQQMDDCTTGLSACVVLFTLDERSWSNSTNTPRSTFPRRLRSSYRPSLPLS